MTNIKRMKVKDKKSKSRLSLERVIGVSTTNSHGLAVCPSSDEIAYPAGAVVVVYNTRKHLQKKFLVSPSNSAVLCVCFSSNGKFIAVGEGGECGESSSVTIWDVEAEEAHFKLD